MQCSLIDGYSIYGGNYDQAYWVYRMGDMGVPMAQRLVDVGTSLTVWSRGQEKRDLFSDSSASIAESPSDVFQQCNTIIFMLATAEGLGAVLGRGTPTFDELCSGHQIVQMGTTLPEYSKALEADIHRVGGRYAEVPVSGSSQPAALGQLVAMQAGDPDVLKEIEDDIAPLFAAKVDCGAVPAALQMKLAVNTCLAGVMFGLVESTNLARKCGLDMQVFRQVLEAGQMSSPVLKMKLPKLVDEDFTTQASVFQTVSNLKIMQGAAQEVGAVTPIVDTALELQEQTMDLGLATSDMIAAIRTYQRLNRD